jgi:hypothetical protein
MRVLSRTAAANGLGAWMNGACVRVVGELGRRLCVRIQRRPAGEGLLRSVRGPDVGVPSTSGSVAGLAAWFRWL